MDYDQGKFSYQRDEERIRAYEAVDGCYVITSDTAAEDIPTEQVRDRYKSLAMVEQAFRTMKSTELYLRPLRHWNPQRVKGHVFVCMLAYMIVWQARHMFRAFITGEDGPDSVPPGDSLRSVWDDLRGVKIGAIKIGTKIHEQINPLTGRVKSMLKSAGASLTAKARIRLRVVG